jgi:hypothetical protein
MQVTSLLHSAPSQERLCECQKPNWEHHLHWRNTAQFQMEYCPRCEDIKTFHWKSFWRRLKGVFINETL